MRKLTCFVLPALGLFLLLVPVSVSALDNLSTLYSQVESLNIQRQGYVLGKPLTDAQKALARRNPLETDSPAVYKFSDNDLHVVADQATHRVLILYERYTDASQEKIRHLVGDLFMAFEDPTVSAHDKVVYWAWGKKGKFTKQQYDLAKEKKNPLSVFATVKLNSDVPITADAESSGDVYYIISSDPILRHFQ